MMHITFFSPIPYHFLHQRPQKIVEHFRKKNISVTYIEPIGWQEYLGRKRKGFLVAALRSLCYHLQAILSLIFHRHLNYSGRKIEVSVTEQFRILSLPLVYPINKTRSSIITKITSLVYRHFLLTEVLPSSGNGGEAAAIIEHPFWGSVLQKDDFDFIMYDSIDELMLYVGRNDYDRFKEFEKNLVMISDCIVTTAKALENHIANYFPNAPVYRIPNGVDYDWFVKRADDSTFKPDYRTPNSRIAGYIGSMFEWIDYGLIEYCARQSPDITFVFIGPIENLKNIDRLHVLSNFIRLDQIPYNMVPIYMSTFDVCLIPFLEGKIAKTTNPVKLYEYFALGKPVVTTALNEVRQYQDERLVYIGNSREEYLRELCNAFTEEDVSLQSKRRAVAKEHSWQFHAEQMIEIIQNNSRS